MYQRWYENGPLLLETTFQNGKLEGSHQWYENGQLQYEGTFQNEFGKDCTNYGTQMVNCNMKEHGETEKGKDCANNGIKMIDWRSK